MSDEQQRRHQAVQVAQAEAQAETATGDRWGGPISADRQAELQGYLDRWAAETNHGERTGPFDWLGEPGEQRLTGADVFWLAQQSGLNTLGQVPNLHLEGERLEDAHLVHAGPYDARLDYAILLQTHLEGAFLAEASFDKTSRLNNASLTGASFDQVIFDNTNLTVVDWSLVRILGDERTARERKGSSGKPKPHAQRLTEYKAAARANRVLAVALEAQGLVDDADRFAFRAQVLQRRVLRLQALQAWRRPWRLPGAVGRYLGSWVLALLAGYGYRLSRIVVTYALALAAFTIAYWALGIHSFGGEPWWQAMWDSFLVSLSAIHGRTTFEQLGAWSPAAWVAGFESVVGIVIEGAFVAMLIQRFFGK
jgi:hypothetical protein